MQLWFISGPWFPSPRIFISGAPGPWGSPSYWTRTRSLQLWPRPGWNTSTWAHAYLVEVEDEIELAHVAEVLVQDLHEGVDQFQDYQLIVALVHDGDEVQTGVTLVHDLVFLVVDEIAHLRLASDHQLVDLCSSYHRTYFRNRCFSCWDMLDEYHLVSRERPWRLIRKKQWIISGVYI